MNSSLYACFDLMSVVNCIYIYIYMNLLYIYIYTYIRIYIYMYYIHDIPLSFLESLSDSSAPSNTVLK